MFCGFTWGRGWDCESAQLVPLIGWHGILALGGILPLMLFSACCSAAGISPLVRRPKLRSRCRPGRSAPYRRALSRPTPILSAGTAVAKGGIRQLLPGDGCHYPDDVMGGEFLYEAAHYLSAGWMPTLLNHRGIGLQQASWVTAAFTGWRHAWRAVTRRVDGPATVPGTGGELCAGRGLRCHDRPEATALWLALAIFWYWHRY